MVKSKTISQVSSSIEFKVNRSKRDRVKRDTSIRFQVTKGNITKSDVVYKLIQINYW